MKIAHLILAHKNPVQLHRLITVLNHPAFDFYIHIDKKADDAAFKILLGQKNVFFINQRAKIYWGGWGTIQATLNAFEMILPKGYDYINVLSAQDFPIKPAEFIYQYFYNNKGTEFITCDFIKGDWADVAPRITDYHLINWRIPGKHRLEKIITKILPRRIFPLPYKIVGRANWFSITGEAALYAVNFLKQHPEMVCYFKYCWGADEFIFSTTLYNSHFRERVKDNLVYVDWTGKAVGHPKLLVEDDYEKLVASEKLFARKFDMDIDDRILFKLEKFIGRMV